MTSLVDKFKFAVRPRKLLTTVNTDPEAALLLPLLPVPPPVPPPPVLTATERSEVVRADKSTDKILKTSRPPTASRRLSGDADMATIGPPMSKLALMWGACRQRKKKEKKDTAVLRASQITGERQRGTD